MPYVIGDSSYISGGYVTHLPSGMHPQAGLLTTTTIRWIILPVDIIYHIIYPVSCIYIYIHM